MYDDESDDALDEFDTVDLDGGAGGVSRQPVYIRARDSDRLFNRRAGAAGSD